MSVPAAKVTGCGIPETKQQHECLKSQIPGINPRKPLFKRGSSSNDLHAHAQQASYTHRKRYISTLSKQPPHHAQNLRSYQHSHEAVPSLPMDPLPWYLPSTTENEKKKKRGHQDWWPGLLFSLHSTATSTAHQANRRFAPYFFNIPTPAQGLEKVQTTMLPAPPVISHRHKARENKHFEKEASNAHWSSSANRFDMDPIQSEMRHDVDPCIDISSSTSSLQRKTRQICLSI